MNKENDKDIELLFYKSIENIFTIIFERIENLEKIIKDIEKKN